MLTRCGRYGIERRDRIDQAKRGYDVAADDQGQIVWYNPFYVEYAPDEEGNFNGQTGTAISVARNSLMR